MPLSSARIAVIDSNRLFRAGLVSLLAQETGQTICETSSVQELDSLIGPEDAFDLVLLEVCTGNGNDPCPVAQLRSLLPGARLAMLADSFDAAQLRICFAAGADGFLLKNIGSETLLGSLNLILLGEKIFPSPLADLLTRDGHDPLSVDGFNLRAQDDMVAGSLSLREVEILRCLVVGDSNKRIANRLNIAEATVKVHLKSILRKTRAMNRTQAAIWALQRGVSGMAATTLVLMASGEVVSMMENAPALAMV